MLLRGAVGAAGAAAILGSTANRASAKIFQAAVAYQPQPNGDKRCDKCVQFLPPNACKDYRGHDQPTGLVPGVRTGSALTPVTSCGGLYGEGSGKTFRR